MKKTALIVGAGPAGLMAADVLSAAGVAVTLADAMPSIGRKFLMAGKSGLNLTKAEDAQHFLHAFGDGSEIRRAVNDFDADAVIAWATALGQPLFTGSTGRVFPTAMKASPLLRAWLARLDSQGVQRQMRWRWLGWDGAGSRFATPTGEQTVSADITVLAMGGASWKRLGSDGVWAAQFVGQTTDFRPANMGFTVDWTDHMEPHLGKAVKATALHAGDTTSRGEWLISASGIEGGGIYAVASAVRDGAPLHLDLLPDWTLDRVRSALTKPRGKASLTNHLRKVLRLDPVRLALLSEWGRPFPDDLAPLIKALPVTQTGPRPLDEAISTAGGLRWDALDGFTLRDRPGTFCAGEMLDWEAPTGGYLITACLATGRAAALQALSY